MLQPVLLIMLVLAGSGAPEEWEYGPRGWREGRSDAPALVEPRAGPVQGRRDVAATGPTFTDFDPVFQPIIADLENGRGKRAFKKSVDWLKRHPGEPAYDQALYLAAEGLFIYGNRVKSFFYLDQLLDQYPESPLWGDALQKQYQIADAYLDGYKDRLLYVPLTRNTSDGIEMLFRIRERVPLSPLGERALLRTGDYYYGNEEYDLAALVYGTYLDRFGRSPQAPRVKLRQAYSNLLQFEGPRYDPTPVIDARTQLRELRSEAPRLAAEANVEELLADIDRQLARKLLETGDYYRRTGEPRAAALSWQELLDTYPDLPEAGVARRRMDNLNLPADALPAEQPTPATQEAGDAS